MKGMFWSPKKGFFESEGEPFIDWLKKIKPVNREHAKLLKTIIEIHER